MVLISLLTNTFTFTYAHTHAHTHTLCKRKLALLQILQIAKKRKESIWGRSKELQKDCFLIKESRERMMKQIKDNSKKEMLALWQEV